MDALKIGILLDPERELMDYEVRFFHTLLNDEKYELVCTIKDGRTKKHNSFMPTIFSSIAQGRVVKSILNRIIGYAENRLLKGTPELPFEREQLRAELTKLPCIVMEPTRSGTLDYFSQTDCTRIKSYNLDVLLKHEFGIVRGKILSIPKFGLWCFHHTDYLANGNGPNGFWETYNKEPITEVALLAFKDELDKGRIIQKACYNTSDYWYLNRERMLEFSVEVILKQLRLLYENREISASLGGIYTGKPYETPSSLKTLDYILRRYPRLATRKFGKAIGIGSKNSTNVWKLHIGRGHFDNMVLLRSTTIEPPRNEFWADPFLFEFGSQLYVFFENYEYTKGKAKISVGVVEKDKIVEIQDSLDTNYHLSYPFVFEHNNEIFMIPETHQKNRLEIWKCDNFPDTWSLRKTCFEGVCLADSTIAKDTTNQYWLFTNISRGKLIDHSSYLYVYKIDGPMMNEIIPHRLNPVVSDCRTARNASNIYIDKRGRLI
ncbi:MAG: glucosamine inositolphosphorylceramide transferase family protein, partial [Planctomycetota bacterium]